MFYTENTYLLVKAEVLWDFDGQTDLSCTKWSRTDTEERRNKRNGMHTNEIKQEKIRNSEHRNEIKDV